MSVFVKDINVPIDCDSCWHPNCSLWLQTDVGSRHPDCPLRPLPEKHGRLIDVDVLLDVFEKDTSEQNKFMELFKQMGDEKRSYDISRVITGMITCRRAVDDALTIVEAEG